MDRRDDNRSKKVIFVFSCLLNTNNKVKGLARYPGMCKEVFDTLYENDLGIQQMDCPCCSSAAASWGTGSSLMWPGACGPASPENRKRRRRRNE